MSWELQARQVELPRYSCGVDYGAPRCLLVGSGSRRLEWRCGSSLWQGGALKREWVPGRLALADRDAVHSSVTLFEGRFGANRLTPELLRKIAAWLGATELPTVRRGSTYLWRP